MRHLKSRNRNREPGVLGANNVSAARFVIGGCVRYESSTMPSQIQQRVVRASNMNFSVLEMGDSTSPLVLCLHGFPDTAHSFRHQMPALAGAGYHCVAPFMRGYSPSEPAPDGRYDSAALSADP